MNDLTLNILGFAAANRDLSVEIRDPITQDIVHVVKPFLDGTARVPRIAPGTYEVTLKHPNLALPVLRRPIRILPSGSTKISVVIDPARFRDTPIEDIPEANLAPVREAAASVAETLAPQTNKQPGEAILADDWNQLASGVRDLALAVAELTRLVSPTGHDHPELIRKFDEVTTNVQTLVEAVSTAVTELQRGLQIQALRQQIADMLTLAEINPESADAAPFFALIATLEQKLNEPPEVFAREMRNVSVRLSTLLEELLDRRRDDQDFVTSPVVKGVVEFVDKGKAQRTTTYEGELKRQRLIARSLAGNGFILQR